jgi:hypothetical protein
VKYFYKKTQESVCGAPNGLDHKFWRWEENKWESFQGQNAEPVNCWTENNYALIYQTEKPVVWYAGFWSKDPDQRIEGAVPDMEAVLPFIKKGNPARKLLVEAITKANSGIQVSTETAPY